MIFRFLQIAFLGILLASCTSQPSDEGVTELPSEAILTLTPNNHEFPLTRRTTNSEATFTLQNSGEFIVSGIQFTNMSSPFTFVNQSSDPSLCGSTLEKNSSCQFVVRFSPTQPEVYSENFTLTYFDGTQTQSLNLAVDANSFLEANPPTNLTLVNPVSSPSAIQTPTIRVSGGDTANGIPCLLYTSPSPRDRQKSRMPSSA